MKRTINKKKIVVAHFQNIVLFPPVINLIECMLNNGHYVYLVAANVEKMPVRLLEHKNLEYTSMPLPEGTDLLTRVKRNRARATIGKKAVQNYMQHADILWTTTDMTVRSLKKEVVKYRHVMQLMELVQWYPLFGKSTFLKFSIDKCARKAWKLVVPEINRAYIQKAWWKLDKLPYVLPNKPYQIEPGEIPQSMEGVVNKIKNEKRKIVLFLGAVNHDRDLEPFIEAVKEMGDEYCLYLVGWATESGKKQMDRYLQKYKFIEYLGYFPAPKHLLFVQYAYIGLLPYIPSAKLSYRTPLNALYCAPNKIFEYAGYGVPMVGTDVPGLSQPFQQYDIGVCCKELTADSVIEAIRKVEQRHDEISANCKKFYDSVDLDQILEDILYEEV